MIIPDHTPHNYMKVSKSCMEGTLIIHFVYQRLSLTDETFLFAVIKDPPVVSVILLRGQTQVHVRKGIAVLANLFDDVKVVHGPCL